MGPRNSFLCDGSERKMGLQPHLLMSAASRQGVGSVRELHVDTGAGETLERRKQAGDVAVGISTGVGSGCRGSSCIWVVEVGGGLLSFEHPAQLCLPLGPWISALGSKWGEGGGRELLGSEPLI